MIRPRRDIDQLEVIKEEIEEEEELESIEDIICD